MHLLKYITKFPCPNSEHVSFLINKKGRIISIGRNSRKKTHPLAEKFPYRWNSTHSELNAIAKASQITNNMVMVNIRRTDAGKLGMARPCKGCMCLLKHFGIKKVWYTNNDGVFEFEELVL